jgi:hypothetical protein
MLDAHCLKALPTLLQHSLVEVRQAACRLLCACATDASAGPTLDTLKCVFFNPILTDFCFNNRLSIKNSLLPIVHALASNNAQPSALALAAYKQLLSNNLSQKYAVFGRLLASDVITAAALFFDAGPVKRNTFACFSFFPFLLTSWDWQYSLDTAFPLLPALQAAPLAGQRPVYLVDHTSASLSPLLAAAATAVGRDASVTAAGLAHATPVGNSGPHVTNLNLVPPPTGEETSMAEAAPLPPSLTVPEKLAALAALVAKHLGGAVQVADVRHLAWALDVAALSEKHGSAVVPLAELSTGTYVHRALLFKTLADSVGLPSALVRGKYQRAYNVVYLGGPAAGFYVVDVMHTVGTLRPVGDGSLDALAAMESSFFELAGA